MARRIAQVPSTGIVSTGKEWILLRYYLLPEPYVVQSDELRRDVMKVVGMIVGALNLQKEVVDTIPPAKKQKV